MYSTSSYPTSPPNGYTSPPPDAYRASPMPAPPKQAYGYAPQGGGANSGYPQMNQRGQSSRSHHYSSSSGLQSAPQTAYPTPPGARDRYMQQPGQLPSAAHKGTLAPGQLVTVGDSTVRIERYLSEGGYAHVYLTTSERPIYPPVKGSQRSSYGQKGFTQHCLKRIAFQEDNVWVDVRKEIEVMKALPPNPHLVQYLGSAHTKLPNGTHEVFILMEFAAGGGIIDLLNKRLRDRLKEAEILNIFTDVCEAVAAMHALKRPLLHRDLKIENVLSAPTSDVSSRRPMSLLFKLCDFGSTTYPAGRPPSTKIEADALALDLNKHTTLQYRSPEMVEPMLGLAVGLPSDVWALGVLLYKLCYYTTPFEEHGTLAIVNAKYTFPQYPLYSPRLQHLIASMLVEQPIRRPTVFEVLKTAHEMNGTRPLIDYPTPSRAFNSPTQSPRPTKSTSSTNLLDFTSPSPRSGPSTPSMQPSLVSSVQPQRRGRPTRENSQKAVPAMGQHLPMPTPPAILPQTSLIDSSIASSSAPLVPLQTNTSATSGPTKSGLQVTGESLPKVKSPTGMDAFGMTSSQASSPRKFSGFGDSFGASASPSFGSQAASKSTVSSRSSDPDDRAKSPPGRGFSSNFGSMTMSPPPMNVDKVSNHSASSANGELNFETRFPSIETLNSNNSDPTAVPSRNSSHLISPIDTDVSRPVPGARKPSMTMNMTGGDLSPIQKTRPRNDFAPQPRSTHVTGTAFKEESGMLSPAPSSIASASLKDYPSNKDYFNQALSAEDGKNVEGASPIPPDLMTGDDETLGGSTAMRPTLSSTSNTTAHGTSRPSLSEAPSAGRSAQMIPPATGHSGPLLPQLNSPRPANNIESDHWSPSDDAAAGRSSSAKAKNREDSSDDEEGPESATGAFRRPASPERRYSQQRPAVSPSISQRASMFGGEAPRSISPTKAKTTPLPPSVPKPQGFVDQGQGRPASMFVTFPPTGMRSPSSTKAERPGHSRKGSINDMVNRFEGSSLDSGPVSPNKIRPAESESKQESAKSRPGVATKPAALRKASMTEAPRAAIEDGIPNNNKSPPNSATAATKTKPLKPTSSKPNMTKPSEPKKDEDVTVEKPKTASKSRPEVKPKPSLNTTTSSIGRASVSSRNENKLISPIKSKSPTGSGRSSPEKQQSVNSLIARWNKGS